MTQTQPSTHAVEAVKACNRIVDVTPESIHRTRIIQSAINAATADLQKESDEFRALFLLASTLSKNLGRERDELLKENTHLRSLIAMTPYTLCIYCGLTDMSKCSKGFPGCAKADDIICGHNEWHTEVRKERDELLSILRDVEWSKDSLGCPVCQWTVRTHQPDCRLARALKGAQQ